MKREKIDWASHVAAFEASGQKAPAYCEAAGLNVGTFRHHLYKHRSQQKSGTEFHQILINTELSLTLDEHGQVTIGGIEPDLLPALVRVWSDAVSQ
jgi:hypothetical protein